jgi:hypothetical protein
MLLLYTWLRNLDFLLKLVMCHNNSSHLLRTFHVALCVFIPLSSPQTPRDPNPGLLGLLSVSPPIEKERAVDRMSILSPCTEERGQEQQDWQGLQTPSNKCMESPGVWQ